MMKRVKTRFRISVPAAAVLAAALLVVGCGNVKNAETVAVPAPTLKAGFARVDITPDFPVKLAGYGFTIISEDFCRQSKGAHDPLYATAVALQDRDGPPVIHISLDTVSAIITDIVKIQDRIAAGINTTRERVIISATHSHGSPDTVGIWGVIVPPISGRTDAFIDLMISGAVEAGIEAFRSRRPAVVKAAVGQESRYHYNISVEHDPEAVTDSTMTVLAFHEPDGGIIGTLMNWGCHPTVMGPKNDLITADYPGAYYRHMDAEAGGINMFVNGSIGAAVRPRNEDFPFPDQPPSWGTWEDVDRLGRGLADTARGLIQQAVEIKDTGLSVITGAFETTMLNPFYALFGMLDLIPREVPRFGENAETYFSVWRMGPVSMATVPGESAPNIGLELKDLLGGAYPMISNIGQDGAGYILTEEQYRNIRYIEFWLICPGPYMHRDMMAAYEEALGGFP